MKKTTSIKIVNYEPKYQLAFREMNIEWIKTYFKMEKEDYNSLNNPEEYILQPGGAILVALYDNEPAGVCALIKLNHEKYDFELAKMAVSPKFHGNGIGYLLGKAVIEKAKELNAKIVYLESNTILKPAISLYHKLGFKEIKGLDSPYERCNIQMELILK